MRAQACCAARAAAPGSQVMACLVVKTHDAGAGFNSLNFIHVFRIAALES
jgi:hypothetical protein